MGTFSKMGLAGLRIGYAFGHPEIIHALDAVRLPYNIGSANQALACAALDNAPTLRHNCERICQSRGALFDALNAFPGLQVFPSAANFLTARLQRHGSEQVYQALLSQGVLVKNLHRAHPLLENCLRFSVGTETDNQALLAALRHAMG